MKNPIEIRNIRMNIASMPAGPASLGLREFNTRSKEIIPMSTDGIIIFLSII
jgi:hypothetical protein